MAIDPASQSIFNELTSYLQYLGLGNLFSVGADGTPSGWLWDKITAGIDTPEQLIVALEGTQEFKTRYKVIFDLRARAAAGEPVTVPSVGEVREYEETVANMMRQSGMPTWFYDSYTDMQDLMGKGISPAELETRIATGWTTVRDINPAIRQAFSDFYGVGTGDAALAAFVLDPTITIGSLERSSRAAYTAGFGSTMGFTIGRDLAEQVAAIPKSEAGIYQDLTEASRLRGLTVEGITEADDIAETTAIEAVSLGSAQAQSKLERRQLERQAAERSSTGGAAMTQQGLIGARTA